MTRGDECCFVCEAGKVAPNLTEAHTAVMEAVVRSRVGKEWRYCQLQYESRRVGVLESGMAAANALLKMATKKTAAVRV